MNTLRAALWAWVALVLGIAACGGDDNVNPAPVDAGVDAPHDAHAEGG